MAEGTYSQTKELTLLLLGETGVGKSTFINAFYHYLLFDNLSDASKGIRCLIPCQFTVFDENSGAKKAVLFGPPDHNENSKATKSNTQCCKCHKWQIGNYQINLIDTPGIGDTEGLAQDQKNMDNLLNFIKNFKEINAICILLKPNNSRLSIFFKYCVLELLKFLNNSATKNIVFLFTNSRQTFYRPGDTGAVLLDLLAEITQANSDVEIAFKKENWYCFDNESFRFLAAISCPNPVKFDADEQDEFERSWKRGVRECERLMRHIVSLPPHPVQDTISLNNARAKIMLLKEPLGEITKNIPTKTNEIEKKQEALIACQSNVAMLRNELETEYPDVEEIRLDKPITVCTHENCCERISANGLYKQHFPNPCHRPCYLTGGNGRLLGNTALLECDAFIKQVETGRGHCKRKELMKDNDHSGDPEEMVACIYVRTEQTRTCQKCGHELDLHMHNEFGTRVVTRTLVDPHKLASIKKDEDVIWEAIQKIESLTLEKQELIEESNLLNEIAAKFAWFLKKYSIVALNDTYHQYIEYVIKNAKENKGDQSQANVEKLEKLRDDYVTFKEVFTENLKRNPSEEITPRDVDSYITMLCELKHSGPFIKAVLVEGDINSIVLNEQNTNKVLQHTDKGALDKLFKKVKSWF